MGIPSYFRHIVTRYSDALIEQYEFCNKEQYDRLFIDFNCILHKCANEIISKYLTANAQEIESLIMRESIAYVEHITNLVNPIQLIYIAIDGVCPRAKMTQQRKRRYISAWKTQHVQDNKDYQTNTNQNWNSSIITPGTTFMKTFDDLIKNHFKGRTKFIVSGSSEFGEGEHKIYEYMREERENERGRGREYNDVIYGLDADIILLSILNLDRRNQHTIRLMRECVEFKQIHDKNKNRHRNRNQSQNEFMFLNINRLSESMFEYYVNPSCIPDVNPSCIPDTNFQNGENALERFMRDYVILCTLIGNDFLPPLSYLKVRNDGIDYVIREYIKVSNELKSHLVNENAQINDVFLTKLLKRLADTENENMLLSHKSYLQPYIPQTHLQSYRRKLFELDNYPSYHKIDDKSIDCSKLGWRTQYYQQLFHGDMVTDICKNYVEGLQWVVDYYIKQEPILDWYYKYCYSPTIFDLSNFLEFEMRMKLKIDIKTVMQLTAQSLIPNENFKNMMKDGLLQLIMVLPPSSSYLIPDQHKAKIMHDISLGCLHYFPQQFIITTFLKNYLWECSAVLPDIDLEYLHTQLFVKR